VILYLDSSALVKRYVTEPGSAEVERVIAQARIYGTGMITQVEVVAALAKSVRVKKLTAQGGDAALRSFRVQWRDLVRLQVSDSTIARAADLAWEYGLRGYDAVHLAAACAWADAMGSPVTFATFDRGLWSIAPRVGLVACPDELPSVLE
jgi:predicted nucleic acid-binding protein